MSDGDAEGEVTPRASHRASSPERTPGRSPEGHVAFLVQEAEERSQRRAAAIRHVLESIRIAPPLPGQTGQTGQRAETPTADFEAALVDSESGGVRSSQESTTLEELLPRVAPQAVTGPENSQEMLEAWKTRCESLEKALDNCRLEAQESQEASQAELAAVEGRVAKREAELRQEIIDLRSQHSKEREKWRAEGKRLQSSIKETQRRAKAESEAKCAAAEQVEVLRQQLARLDSKRSRDEKEAKHSEEMNQRHTEFLRWVASQCAAALGEALDTNVSEDLTRQLVSRVTSQRGRQLQEGRHAEVKTDKSERSEKSENLHTEWRGRVRAAEQAQKKMQRLMQKEAEAQEAQREMQTEEMVELKLRVNALQRAKEVSERFVEEEEESWLQSKAQLREAETEALSAMASARHFEAEARCASADAVRAQAKATGAEAAQRRLQAEVESLQREAQRSPPPLPQDLGKVQQTWRDAAVLEEVSAAQQQMGHWRNEAERSCVELTKLRASCEQLQLQSAEQAKVEEAKRRLMQQALKEQAQEMQREFDQALREVQDLRDKQSFQLQEKAQELRDNENAVSTLTSELEDLRSKQVESDSRLEQLQDELSKSADLLHSSEALMQEWQNEAQQQKEQLSEEVFELHQSYAKRLQNLRAQHGGEKRAFQAVEDELRQIYTQEVQVCRRNQEAWAEATEAALAGEVAQARLARMAVEESESAALRHETQVQEKLQEQLVMLKNHLGGEAPSGLHPASHELFKQLCVSVEAALCDEVRGNPCSELRRTLRRDLKQELRDQLRSEVHSVRRCREASTGSTTGSSARRLQAPGKSPPSAIRQELTRRGAALMEAFTAAAEEMPQWQQ